MLAYMQRTTIEVDDEVEARMRQEAARRGITVSEWVREGSWLTYPGAPVQATTAHSASQAPVRAVDPTSPPTLTSCWVTWVSQVTQTVAITCRVEVNECRVWSSPHVRPRDAAAFTLLPG